jgi:hypothetical protein
MSISGLRAHFGATQQGTHRHTIGYLFEPSEEPPMKPRTVSSPPVSRRDDDRPTEDDLARAALGGPKGSPKLKPAPLTKTEAEQNLPNDEPGHVA